MSRFGGGLTAVGGSFALFLLGLVAPAYAGNGSFQDCVNQAVNHNGEPPTCTKVDGAWVASWPDDSAPRGGFGGLVVFLFLIGTVVGIGLLVWRVTTAQRLAKESGMDPGLATQMTLLSDDGLDATFLASALRNQNPHAPEPTSNDTRSTVDRLEELKRLLDQGLVTQAEYDERRTAIIDSV